MAGFQTPAMPAVVQGTRFFRGRREQGAERCALGFLRAGERQVAGSVQKLQGFTQGAGGGEVANYGGGGIRGNFPGSASVKSTNPLPGTKAIVTGAAGKPGGIKVFIYPALVVACQIWAGQARRFVDGKAVARVERKCQTAKRLTVFTVRCQKLFDIGIHFKVGPVCI